MQTIGPLLILDEDFNAPVSVPLATFEAPLWASTHRGARVSVVSGGIRTTLIDDRMTRSIVLSGPHAGYLLQVKTAIESDVHLLKTQAETSSRFTTLININTHIVGNLLYVRLEFTTGDASGHNMVTLAADHVMRYLLATYTELHYGSISGNVCTDKKVSSVNSLLGRGKYVIADISIDRKTCARYLKTTPEKMVKINIEKNLVGSIVAGSLHSANAHYANLLLGIYLATGQDAANIVEGSQGITYAEIQNDQLYFSVTLPNIIVGTVGAGKTLAFVKENLALLGCAENNAPSLNAKRLAKIVAATVLCGELSCLAAQTNPGELITSHLRIERHKGETCA